MNTKLIRNWAAVAAALALVACGGGDPDVPGSGSPSGAPTTKGSFNAVVSFGDSLSDVGSYAPATSLAGNGTAPYMGGRFTTNSATAKVWVENVAAALPTPVVVTPAEVGFAGQSVKCPAAANPALASTCTAYGQGGARVTNAVGVGNASGALTVPVKTQIANHLARFTSFKDTDLIFVYAGNNDGFVNFSAFATKAAQIQAQAAAGQLTADQANLALFEAQTEGQAAMKQAAQELTGYIRSEILAKGGKYVAVINLPDSTLTPLGGTLPATARPVLSGFVDTFNLWLRDGLTGAPVQIIDANTIQRQVYANPAAFGFTNVTTPACSAQVISAITGGRVTDGSSLFCNATTGAPYNGLTTGADVNTWLFADSVHPTTGGHAAFGQAVIKALQGFGWI